MGQIRSVCVYCGSGSGVRPAYAEAAAALGRTLAEKGIKLVYGGGRIGLMGVVARSTMEAGGTVTGVIPDSLRRIDVQADDITELRIVESMHARKMAMYEESDAFIVLPGGIGTLDEAIEMIGWGQLGWHAKPVVFLDLDKYWAPLFALLDHVIAEGFAAPEARRLWAMASKVEDLLPVAEAFLAHKPHEPGEVFGRPAPPHS